MTPTLGPIGEIDLETLARAMAPRDRVTVFAIETEAGWRTYGFRGSTLVWAGGAEVRDAVEVRTLFGMTDGKYVFQRSESSSSEALDTALAELRQGRNQVYRSMQVI